MNVALQPLSSADEPVMNRLMQLYVYDFSEFMGLDIADDGIFFSGESQGTYHPEPRRHAFLLRVDGRLAGFVILDEKSRLTGDPDVVDVAQFFVMRKYRRQGVGAMAAVRAFDLFPRKWEVRQTASNVAATAFWRETIARYTGGRFEEVVLDDERWRGPVQSFDARARGGGLTER
jgi:predicted acetyltransferase